MNLNAILSGMSAWPVKSAGGGPPGVKPPSAAEARAPSAGQDVFEPGQWWKNRAMAKVDAAAAGACSCGSCSSCGVRAYAAFTREPGLNSGAAAARVVGGESVPAGGRADAGGGFYPSAGGAGEAGRFGGAAAKPSAPPTADPLDEPDDHDQPAIKREAGRAAVQELSREEKLEVARLQQLDTRVKAHEMAHLAVAGPYARGGANFTYATGPDGKNYAVGGEVSIDTSKEPSPEATIRKMQVIRAAAMAPADPSSQDRKVASQADAALTEARRELEMIRLEQQREASRRELDMRMLGGDLPSPEQHDSEVATAPDAEGTGYTSPFGPASPIAARRATAALAAFDQTAAQLHIRA